MRYNVLQLTDSFNQGGSERQAAQLACLLRRSGRYNVHVACLNRSGALLEDVKNLGFDDIPEFRLTSFYNSKTLTQLRRFAALLRERAIDIVHTHDFYTNIFGMAAAALARVPVRVASRRQSAVRSVSQRLVERCAYRLADSIVVNCNEIGRQLIREGVPAEKITTVYNGVNMARILPPPNMKREDLLARFNLPPDENLRFVTIVANIRAVKDHTTFLKMAARVRAAVPDAAFIIAGDGELMNEMKRLAARLGLERSAFFIGRCERVAELLALSDVCALSSTSEGFSNSILEYMTAGRPVVATDVGGAREAVIEGETGHLVSVGDEESMAARVIQLLSAPEKARAMGECGRHIIEEKFSCQAQLEHVENLYAKLLALARPSLERPVEGIRRECAK